MMKRIFVLILVFTCYFQIGFGQDWLKIGSKTNAPKIGFFQDDEEEWEDDGRGFSMGINLGVYFANKKSANVYNGTCSYNVEGINAGVRCYEIYERLTLNLNDINYITSYYNITSFEAPADMHPLNMRYTPAMCYGLRLKYNFNSDNAIVFNANFAKVKAADKFTLRFVGGPIQPNAQDNIQIFNITGEEDRFQMSMVYRGGAMINDQTNFYFELGPSMVGVKVLENKIFVAERTYDLFIGAQNPNQLVQYRPRTDVGFGYKLGTGFEMVFNEKYEVDLGFTASREKVILGTFEDKVWNFAIMFGFSI